MQSFRQKVVALSTVELLFCSVISRSLNTVDDKEKKDPTRTLKTRQRKERVGWWYLCIILFQR